jgi:hypothetical protein
VFKVNEACIISKKAFGKYSYTGVHKDLLFYQFLYKSPVANGYGLEFTGSNPSGGWEFFSSPSRLERFWGPPSLYYIVYILIFPGYKSDRGVKLITHLLVVSRSRMRGTIPPSQYVFMAWCLVKHRDNFSYIIQFREMVSSQPLTKDTED